LSATRQNGKSSTDDTTPWHCCWHVLSLSLPAYSASAALSTATASVATRPKLLAAALLFAGAVSLAVALAGSTVMPGIGISEAGSAAAAAEAAGNQEHEACQSELADTCQICSRMLSQWLSNLLISHQYHPFLQPMLAPDCTS
jgi:hypothetical protein